MGRSSLGGRIIEAQSWCTTRIDYRVKDGYKTALTGVSGAIRIFLPEGGGSILSSYLLAIWMSHSKYKKLDFQKPALYNIKILNS